MPYQQKIILLLTKKWMCQCIFFPHITKNISELYATVKDFLNFCSAFGFPKKNLRKTFSTIFTLTTLLCSHYVLGLNAFEFLAEK